VQNALYSVTERFQNGNIFPGDSHFDRRFDLRALLQFLHHDQRFWRQFPQFRLKRVHQSRRFRFRFRNYDKLSVAGVGFLRVDVVVKPRKALAGKAC